MHSFRSIVLTLAFSTLVPAGALASHATCDYSDVGPGAQVAELTTALGSICIELFDTDAPLTVANFLYYLNNGLLVDTFFHRSIPGFIVQGGGFVVGATDFEVVPPDNGTVINEPCTLDIPAPPPASAGTMICSERGNERGTIALAKIGGDPDSGSTNWFINIADNRTNLDNQNGGFTVFGRVLDMAPVDAIEALTISDDDDVAWMESSIFPAGPVLSQSGLTAPLQQPPLYGTSYGCFDPSDQATVLDAASLPSLVPFFDATIPTIYFTVSAGCGTPTTVATFTEDPGPPECPDLDRITVRTAGPKTLTFPSGSPEYFELTCAQTAEALLQRDAWQLDFVDHFNDNLVTLDVVAVPEPTSSIMLSVGAMLLALLSRSRRATT